MKTDKIRLFGLVGPVVLSVPSGRSVKSVKPVIFAPGRDSLIFIRISLLWELKTYKCDGKKRF